MDITNQTNKKTGSAILIDHISVVGDGKFMVPEGAYEAIPTKGPNNVMQWREIDHQKVSKAFTFYAIPSEMYDADTKKPKA